MLRNLTSWESRLSALVPDFFQIESFIKKASLALLAAQAVLCFGAVVTRVMLHGDGSYFAYLIAVGEPWEFKWKELATRASTYVLTVVPTAFISDLFDLSGEHIAAVNGLTFYGVQWIQYLVVVVLAWRQFPRLLVFPILQYGLSTGLAFGFPSEILLAPGFFWICLFALIRKPMPWPLLYVAFAGLFFSHELAMPSALLVLAFTWRRQRQLEPSRRFSSRLFACFAAAVIAIWLAIRLSGGGGGADSNAIYVFDPRRVLNNPTLWLIATTIVALGATAHAEFTKHRHVLLGIGLTCFFLTAMASLFLDFSQGRYDSARTLIAIWMALLGLIFIYVADRPPKNCDCSGSATPSTLFALKSMVIAMLSINLAASSMFLHEWHKAMLAFSSVVNANPGTGKVEIVSGNQLRILLGPAGSKSNERMGFSWTWPYRSIVAAKDFRPVRVIFDSEEALAQCKTLSLQTRTSRIPAEVIDAVSRYACTQPAPPDRRYFRQWLLNFWTMKSSPGSEKTD
jgi:hypothetical protein